MPASKIQNEQEVLQWFEEGRTYDWMCAEYKRKYNIEVVPSLWGNFRRRRGLVRRIARNDALIPWHVQEEHIGAYPLAMLRVESRLREGLPLRESDSSRLRAWKQMLSDGDMVVMYDPESVDGFYYVPKTPADVDLIREPKVKTTMRPRVD